jgi:predicted TIM-barrel fold metal-dependent hydrolase
MTSEIPNCEGPDPNPVALTFTPPSGTCDTHFHIFGPSDRFPYGPNRKYTPPDSPLEDYFDLMDVLGIERGVVVHPNLHGPDNAVTLDAIARSDGRFLGIVKLEATATFEELKHLHTLGVRGVRFAFNPQHGGTFDSALFDRTAGWCTNLGWQIEIHSAPDDLVELAEKLARAQVPIVIDHMGRVDVSLGTDQEPFRVLLDLVRENHIWVKLTGADRVTKSGAPYDDVVPFAKALVAAAPDRMIWGTDWPHSAYFDASKMPNDGILMNLLRSFVPDSALRDKILVENAASLFGFN